MSSWILSVRSKLGSPDRSRCSRWEFRYLIINKILLKVHKLRLYWFRWNVRNRGNILQQILNLHFQIVHKVMVTISSDRGIFLSRHFLYPQFWPLGLSPALPKQIRALSVSLWSRVRIKSSIFYSTTGSVNFIPHATRKFYSSPGIVFLRGRGSANVDEKIRKKTVIRHRRQKVICIGHIPFIRSVPSCKNKWI